MRILITGADGIIGKEIAHLLGKHKKYTRGNKILNLLKTLSIIFLPRSSMFFAEALFVLI